MVTVILIPRVLDLNMLVEGIFDICLIITFSTRISYSFTFMFVVFMSGHIRWILSFVVTITADQIILPMNIANMVQKTILVEYYATLFTWKV